MSLYKAFSQDWGQHVLSFLFCASTVWIAFRHRTLGQVFDSPSLQPTEDAAASASQPRFDGEASLYCVVLVMMFALYWLCRVIDYPKQYEPDQHAEAFARRFVSGAFCFMLSVCVIVYCQSQVTRVVLASVALIPSILFPAAAAYWQAWRRNRKVSALVQDKDAYDALKDFVYNRRMESQGPAPNWPSRIWHWAIHRVNGVRRPDTES